MTGPSAPCGESACVIPNAPLTPSLLLTALVGIANSQPFARAVLAADRSASAHFSARAIGPDIVLVTASSRHRQDANTTLTVVTTLLTEKVSAMQAASPPGARVSLLMLGKTAA